MPESKGRTYTQEEVNAILSRAVERHNPSLGLSHDELLDVARQAGISEAAVEAAARDLGEVAPAMEEERAVQAELAARRATSWRRFTIHFVAYAMVIGLLVVTNLLVSSFPFAIFPALAWGVAIALHFFAIALPNPRRVEKIRRMRRLYQERLRRQQLGGTIGSSVVELGKAVERGVGVALASAAKRIHEEVARAERGGKARVAGDDARSRVATPPPRPARPRDEDEDEDYPVEDERRREARRRR